MRSKLNDGQLEFFNSISKHAIECKFATKTGLDKSDLFWIYLSDDGGVGKSFLVKLITELLTESLKQSGQDFEMSDLFLLLLQLEKRLQTLLLPHNIWHLSC